MAKIKVGNLAKELGVEAKELIKSLTDLGVVVKTAASSVEDEAVKIVTELFKPKTPVKVAAKTPAKSQTKVAPPAKIAAKLEKKAKVIIPEKIVAPEKKTTPVNVFVPEKVVTPEISLPVVPAPIIEPEVIVTPPVEIPVVKEVKGPIYVIETEDVSVKDLAEKLQVKSSELIKELMKKGIMATINQRVASEVAKEVAANLGKEIVIKMTNVPEETTTSKVKFERRALRPPIVTVMGHVDHGKTKLLDAIRKTKVAEGEAGGITQHIGAYQVTVHGRKVTFLDTPGHAAFTALRARGAKVTDIVVLVVAADDGVKPQTIEAINHAKAAGVPILVAINKVDKPEANLDRVKTQLTEHGLQPEEWGGQTVTVSVSAKQGTGINELLELLLLTADLQELKADPEGVPVGVVVESRLDKGRGAVATVLVKNGTLKIGDIFVCGNTYGKVRALFTDTGARLEKAGPASPVEILGFVDVPMSGDLLEVMSSEKEVRLIAEQKKLAQGKTLRGKVVSLEDFSKQVKEGEGLDLALVVKGDVQGSVDAIIQSRNEIKVGNIGLHIIHSAVGMINESDVILAKASKAILIGFNVNFEGGAENLASVEGVEVRNYNIIYKLLDDVKLAMEGLLEPEYEEVVTGHAEIRQLFSFSKVGSIAGSFVTDGKIVRGSQLRIFRNKAKIYEGKLDTLKRFKDDVKSVEQNFECGLSINGYSDFKVGDIVETFEIREKARVK